MLATAQEEAERLARFVDNLLDMTRLEAGAIGPKREPVDSPTWSAPPCAAPAALLAGHRVVATDRPPDLPLLQLDFVLIEQVLVNLLDNAAKYTPRGQRRSRSPRRRRAEAGRRSRCATRGRASPPEEAGAHLRQVLPRPGGDRQRAAPGSASPSPGASSRPWAARIAARNRRPIGSGCASSSELIAGRGVSRPMPATSPPPSSSSTTSRRSAASCARRSRRRAIATLEAATGAEALRGAAPSPARPGPARPRPARPRRPRAHRPRSARPGRRADHRPDRAAATRRARSRRSTPAPTTTSPSRSACRELLARMRTALRHRVQAAGRPTPRSRRPISRSTSSTAA